MPPSAMQNIGRSLMRLMARVMPSCKEITQLVSEGMDRRLPWRKRLAIRLHLSLCRLCRRYEKQLRLLRAGTRRYADPEQNIAEKSLSTAARDRLSRALDRKG